MLMFALLLSLSSEVRSQKSENPGIRLNESSLNGVNISFSIPAWSTQEVTIGREELSKISMEGSFLPNDAGAPDLPSVARYIAFPKGTIPRISVTYGYVETITGVKLAPAPRIPKTTENGPLHYAKNSAIWTKDAFYPAENILLSGATEIRGIDVALLGITPFQYNPVTEELKVFHNLQVEVTFEKVGADPSLTVGDHRLRSRFWDPVLRDAILNSDIFPAMDHQAALEQAIQSRQLRDNRETGCEYLIIVPDQPEFLAWADTLRRFRNEQGIMTDVMTTAEVGGNTVNAIESFVNNAYDTWDVVPAAILLLADYGTGSSGIIAPIWDNYCASDNIFADVTGNSMPDIVFSRITAQNATHLEIMIGKIIDYETNPPTDPAYYDHPITALGWQTERWFQVCIEVVGGFFRNELGKDPIRINEVYGGNPNVDPWSTAPNTSTIMNYFGPNGLGYIPATPGELGNWNAGNAAMINNAINEGSFLLLHRDHGYELGWGEPAYSNSNMSGLNNPYPTFVYSVNCLTGKYNWSNECFTEAFHRYPQRAFGLIAASEVSYSFVNDTYVWGAFDNMWPEFMPDYGTTPEARGLYPSFSNAAGKYFLEQSGWPYNTGNKEVTYNLFHHHGDAFNELYSEVPQGLVVLHNGVIMGGSGSYSVQADTLSHVALSVDGEIIGLAAGTGSPVEISILPQAPGTEVKLAVTKTNHFRFESIIPVIAPNAPYVVYQQHEINDSTGNTNGLMDYGETIDLSMTVQNIGLTDASDVAVTLSSADPYVILTDDFEFYGTIAGNSSMTLTDVFSFQVADSIPDGHSVFFTVVSSDGDTSWTSQFFITGHAPVLVLVDYTIDDSSGDGNGRIDPGETAEITVTIANAGSSDAFEVLSELICNDAYIDVLTGAQAVGNLVPGDSGTVAFSVYADEATPGGFNATFITQFTGQSGISGQGQFSTVIGQYPALILDLDPNQYSGPVMLEAFSNMDLFADYQVQFPADLNQYKSVFVSLGINFANHILTNDEAGLLADYLDQGGKLFMEGRTTWYDDPQTGLHDMFGVDAVFDNWFLVDTLHSLEGTFTEGMKFGFGAVNPYNKYHLEPLPPAQNIFETAVQNRGSWVAYDAGSYKTVAATMEFGGLVDGEYPSTKENLMFKILEFFGDIVTGTEEPFTGEAEIISVYPNPFTDKVDFRFHLSENTRVTLEIFHVTGQKVAAVFEGSLTKGHRQLTWNVAEEVNGVYFFRLNTGNRLYTGKMIRN